MKGIENMKMRKQLVIAATLIFGSGSAMAAAPGGPGCGWGNMLFDGESGMGSHFLASTTNGTSGNKTFGMTSGTNGCSVGDTLTYGGSSMISSIMDEFSEDVARGHGEALDAVAVMMGVEKADRDIFAAVVHKNFNAIFPNDQVTAQQVTNSLLTVMKSDLRLAKYVA
ncbi:FIG00953225: hypothetical protein [hydrothermal vent metagenome]|uniref:DUF3015 domain-containing protein n=1 Tax=hydrothermal vent metagenome TaxID=652676 RepID=A0A3B0Z2J0_9ZZZZ